MQKRKLARLKHLARDLRQAYKANPELFKDGGFDYPEYGGLSKRWANSLGSGEVDVIQYFFDEVDGGGRTPTIAAMEQYFIDSYDYMT